ncbi:hypothetical protein [Natranaerobius trueperi]|uniref:Uncharacterized protein n=1 Tax=Natranaerobius trueperi TaxID=759412 RepID=A0A226C214_9FIRM|nr:hypothetical protein [Natranaerobius trueperi]OWZ84420.1 hypothetical protein CDO51_03920 [Natranaerobius trueperi]
MSPISPYREDHFYLINKPSESCPFCDDDNIDHMDVVVVWLPSNESKRFTFEPLQVTGKLYVSEELEDIDGHAKSHFTLLVNDMSDIKKKSSRR